MHRSATSPKHPLTPSSALNDRVCCCRLHPRPTPARRARPDGNLDLVFKFKNQAMAATLGEAKDGDMRVLPLSGRFLDGPTILGEDVAVAVVFKKGAR